MKLCTHQSSFLLKQSFIDSFQGLSSLSVENIMVISIVCVKISVTLLNIFSEGNTDLPVSLDQKFSPHSTLFRQNLRWLMSSSEIETACNFNCLYENKCRSKYNKLEGGTNLPIFPNHQHNYLTPRIPPSDRI